MNRGSGLCTFEEQPCLQVPKMELFEILNIVTCVTSSITAIIVCVALLPHVKDGMAIIRDAVLWLALVGLIVALGWLGMDHVRNNRASSSIESPQIPASQSRVDRFYAGR